MKRIISRAIFSAIFLVILFSPFARGELQGKLFLFNTHQDYLKGDLWEFITQDEIAKYLFIYPGNYLVIGIGTTDRDYRTGEVIVGGKVDDILFRWANPEYPNRIELLDASQFPWIDIVACDPNRSMVFTLKDVADLHKYLSDNMVQEGIHVAALHLSGSFDAVQYAISHNLPKRGLDLSRGHSREEYYRTYQVASRSDWEMSGLYVVDEIAKIMGSVGGQPILLAGYEILSKRGGLVSMARVHNARLVVYPIKDWEVIQSDLIVKDLRVDKGKVWVVIENQGGMNTRHVKVRLTLPHSKKSFDIVLSKVDAYSEVEIEFGPVISSNDKTVHVEIDPDNEILELIEDNNYYQYEVGYRLFGR